MQCVLTDACVMLTMNMWCTRLGATMYRTLPNESSLAFVSLSSTVGLYSTRSLLASLMTDMRTPTSAPPRAKGAVKVVTDGLSCRMTVSDAPLADWTVDDMAAVERVRREASATSASLLEEKRVG